MPKKLKAGILISSVVLLGFFRDYLFMNVNWYYLEITKGLEFTRRARPEFSFLEDWSLGSITALKWGLTIFFFLLFMGLTIWVIKAVFENKEYTRVTFYAFLGFFGISGIIYLIYALAGYPLEIYMVIRRVMGLAQSFFPMMLLIILFKFLPEINKSKK